MERSNLKKRIGSMLISIAMFMTANVYGAPPNGNCVGGFAGAAYEESNTTDCWSTGKNVTSEGVSAGIGGFFGYTSGYVNRVYCCCSSNLSDKDNTPKSLANQSIQRNKKREIMLLGTTNKPQLV